MTLRPPACDGVMIAVDECRSRVVGRLKHPVERILAQCHVCGLCAEQHKVGIGVVGYVENGLRGGQCVFNGVASRLQEHDMLHGLVVVEHLHGFCKCIGSYGRQEHVYLFSHHL